MIQCIKVQVDTHRHLGMDRNRDMGTYAGLLTILVWKRFDTIDCPRLDAMLAWMQCSLGCNAGFNTIDYPHLHRIGMLTCKFEQGRPGARSEAARQAAR